MMGATAGINRVEKIILEWNFFSNTHSALQLYSRKARQFGRPARLVGYRRKQPGFRRAPPA
jgi:hypothetical protein